MHTLAASLVLGYHGCDAEIAENILKGEDFKSSTNEYDWLGHGIYFWEANPLRGLEFAEEQKKRRPKDVKNAAVIGAVINLGLCLDLTTALGVEQVRIAHEHFQKITEKAGVEIPVNNSDGLRRNLDCAVVEVLHNIRTDAGTPSIDSVRGAFIEGNPVYASAGFYKKTHIQICVRNPDCIKGVFRVPARHLS